MFKIKLRKILKELFCLHKDLDIKTREIGFQTYNMITCKKCGKIMTEEV